MSLEKFANKTDLVSIFFFVIFIVSNNKELTFKVHVNFTPFKIYFYVFIKILIDYLL